MTPGVVVYRLDDRLFLANASYVRGRVHEALRGASTVTTALVLNAEAITHIDSAGLHALEDLALGKDGIALHFARAKYLIRPDHRACEAVPATTARSARPCTPLPASPGRGDAPLPALL